VQRFSLLAAVLALLLAACGSDASQQAGESPASAPAATAAQAEPRPGPLAGTCADDLPSGSMAAEVCLWVADFDPRVCERMTDRLLAERFGSPGADGVRSCEALIGRRKAVDASAVSFAHVTSEGDTGRLELVDASGGRTFAYEVVFVASGGSWLIDGVRLLERRGSAQERGQPPSDAEVEARAAIRELVRRWYAEVDPGVCDSMTANMLELGWEGRGEAVRTRCRASIAAAEPLPNVRVRIPRIQGDRARVRVAYDADGSRRYDTILLVRREGRWLIDGLGPSGLDP
jgi:hypothetical protein